jgi:hypothetical protein
VKKSPNPFLPKPGMPDGIFSNQRSKFRSILVGLAMEDDGVRISCPFGIF